MRRGYEAIFCQTDKSTMTHAKNLWPPPPARDLLFYPATPFPAVRLSPRTALRDLGEQ